jgi:hypothetical protein
MYYRPSLTSQVQMDSKNSFEFHTWMIARLIETLKSDMTHFLSYYVIAVCYEKMITRMKYRVSTSFRDALKNLPQNFEFPKQFPSINATDSNDIYFIDRLQDFTYRRRIFLKTPIKNLVKHVNDLYNQETYVDFHSILSELLELLFKSLGELRDMHHKLGEKVPSPEKLKEIIAKIEFIAIVETLLRLLVKSRAIKRCLYSIARFLPDRAAGVKAKVDNKMDDERDGDDNNERDREEEEEDGLYRDDEGNEEEELQQGQGSASELTKLETKSQACLRSLNLAVVYTDAILVLSNFVRKERKKKVKIDVKILLLPCPINDEKMLPWKQLLQHEKYFPGKPSPSADEMVDFLEPKLASSAGNQMSRQNTTDDPKSSKKGQKSSKMSLKSKKIPQAVATDVNPESVITTLVGLRHDIAEYNLKKDLNSFDTKIKSVVSSLDALRLKYVSPGSTNYIEHIISKVNLLGKGIPYDPSDKQIDYIVNMLRTLADNTRLEKMLRKGTPLDTGVGFKGRPHAESCIAAHCTFTDPEWFSTVSYFIIMCSDLILLVVRVCHYKYNSSSRCI